MKLRIRLAGSLLSGALLLPGSGTTSRERDFCPAWLALSTSEKHAVVVASESAAGPAGARCRAGLRSGIRELLDSECRNWSQLMDFEIRALVDRVLASCATGDASPGA